MAEIKANNAARDARLNADKLGQLKGHKYLTRRPSDSLDWQKAAAAKAIRDNSAAYRDGWDTIWTP